MIDFFLNPIIKTSLFGTVFMSTGAALIGVLLFLQRRSLIGETLSHAAFPGLLVGIILTPFFTPHTSEHVFIGMTTCAGIFAFLGMKCVAHMEERLKASSDSALTFTLASFMGFGILLASILQRSHPVDYRLALLYLYGQAATITSAQSLLYGGFTLLLILFILSFYPYLKLICFDMTYAKTSGIQYRALENGIFLLLVLTIILGIRSVGVMLMAGMLIAPAVAARPWAKKLSSMLIIGALFGFASAFIGNILSFKLSTSSFSLPTGPMILLSASSLCLISLLIAPKRGLLVRLIRSQVFQFRSKMENSLKHLWKKPGSQTEISPFIRFSLRLQGWLNPRGALTPQGELQAKKIVRLHRLWEVYLVEYLGQSVEKVHRTAEELEHLFSPALEKELSELLNYPLKDPHEQPIPPSQGNPK
jgi:manganese/zinc/iron transport system permease protein